LETIFLINRFTKLFLVKNPEKQEKSYNEHSFDGYIAVNDIANATSQ
jgi:hypothetical protein